MRRSYCSMYIFPKVGVTPSLPGELFAQPFRSAAYTISCSLNWLVLFVVGMVFPILVVSMLKVCKMWHIFKII